MPNWRRKIHPDLQRRIAKAGSLSRERIRVLVKTAPGSSTKLQHVYKCYQNLDLICADLTPAEIIRLARARQIEYIVPNEHNVTVLMDLAAPVVGASRAWRTGLTGRGTTVAVLDTGIYPHPDLSGRITAFYDAVNGRKRPYDDHGHGTHVAGSVASSGRMSGGRYRGIAPGARLVGIKVLDEEGNGATADIVEGIDWMIANKKKYGINAAVMSLGAPTKSHHAFDPLAQAVARAVKAGIAVFVAAGNGGPNPGTIYSPGIEPTAITVGALDDRGTVKGSDDLIADLSSRGPTPAGIVKPDLVAPGVKITSLYVPEGRLYRNGSGRVVNSYYSTLTGTSSATPIVAGIGMLVLEKYPKLTPAQLKKALQAGAKPIAGKRNSEGAGMPNVERALAYLARNSQASRRARRLSRR